MKRARDPNLTEKLAAALLTMKRVDGAGALVPVIPYEKAKGMTAKQIIAHFDFDHHPVRMCDREALAAAGIPDINHPANLDARVRAEHRGPGSKTAKKDMPEIAKRKRITGETKGRPKRKWASRRMRSRNSFQQAVQR